MIIISVISILSTLQGCFYKLLPKLSQFDDFVSCAHLPAYEPNL